MQGKHQREVIYADINVAMAESSTVDALLRLDDQVEYAKLNYNLNKNRMAASPEQEEVASESEYSQLVIQCK